MGLVVIFGLTVAVAFKEVKVVDTQASALAIT
jgi:hypothetical protein